MEAACSLCASADRIRVANLGLRIGHVTLHVHGPHALLLIQRGWCVQEAEAHCDAPRPGMCREEWLEVQAHLTVASYALLHKAVLDRAPRIARSLCSHGVFPLARLHEVCLDTLGIARTHAL